MEKEAKQVYTEFLKNIWISSCTEPRFYYGKGHEQVYRIPEEDMD